MFECFKNVLMKCCLENNVKNCHVNTLTKCKTLTKKSSGSKARKSKNLFPLLETPETSPGFSMTVTRSLGNKIKTLRTRIRSKGNIMQNLIRRERLKSALYLRLKMRKVFKPVKTRTLRAF